MENAEVAATLWRVGDLLELAGENPFKIQAYRRASQVVDTLARPVAELWREGKLGELPGLGERTVRRIGALLETGTFDELERLRREVPPGVLELLAVEGVGPKTASRAWKELGVSGVDSLEEACLDGRLAGLPRMGPQRARSLLSSIERYRARQGRFPLHRALFHAEALVTRLRLIPGVTDAEAVGSVRRRMETVGDLDLLVASTEPERVLRAFRALPEVAVLLTQGPRHGTVRLGVGMQVDLHVVPPPAWGAALLVHTGSKAHHAELLARARRGGLTLSEEGLFDAQGRRLGGEREEDVLGALGLPWIPPELREARGELEAAEAGRLPRLVDETDLLGDLHVHSEVSSDACTPVDVLAREAAWRGRQYLAITDHSRTRPLGLDEVRLAAHVRDLRRLDAELRGAPHLLAGIEVDIRRDGALALSDEALGALDWVVASVHSGFNDEAPRMTARIVRALRSGLVHLLGHPSGRLIGQRDPYAYALDEVLEVARAEDVALEVNAQPDRLDLTDEACRRAKQAGVPVVINSDSHHVRHLDNLRYGIWVARRGWLEAGDVLNALPWEEFRRRLARRRGWTRGWAPEPDAPSAP